MLKHGIATGSYDISLQTPDLLRVAMLVVNVLTQQVQVEGLGVAGKAP